MLIDDNMEKIVVLLRRKGRGWLVTTKLFSIPRLCMGGGGGGGGGRLIL